LTFLTLGLLSALFLALNPTRTYGLLGLTVRLVGYPYWTSAGLIAAAITYYR
jgi:hypothetical protein